MTAYASTAHGRFVRDADRACLAGVCAGIAGRFGFNLFVTRLLAVIAFLAVTPIALIVYFAIVFLVPSESARGIYRADRESRRRRRRTSRRERRQAEDDAREQAREQAREDFDRQCESLDERLARIEKYVTSTRYNLDREFRNL